MLCFCLVSLFMALTLASLSWFGAEAAACCQDYWDYNCPSGEYVPPVFNNTQYTYTTLETVEEHQTSTELTVFTASAVNSTSSCYGPIENGPSCENVKRGYCGTYHSIVVLLTNKFKFYNGCLGYDIGLGRTLHLLLLLAGG